jgi:Protein of unknown function (DUF4242)
MASPDPLQRCFLAEWYQPAVVNCDIDDVATTLGDSAASLHAQGHPVRLLTTFAVPTDQVLYGLFAAESADTVSQACERAGWPADRITGGIHTRIPS